MTPTLDDVQDDAQHEVTLADGTVRSLGGMTRDELAQLQWDQERLFAQRILSAPKRSPQRREAIRHAYDTAPRIFAHVEGLTSEPLVMGMHWRQIQLVRELLQRQVQRGLTPSFFEIGYAGGVLLDHVRGWGYPAGGIEVSPTLREQALSLLGEAVADQLLLGDLLETPIGPKDRCTLAYWNDVFEHIPPDEIVDYLQAIRERLIPGGELVTITPNWHVRPSDVSCDYCSPRTEAAGLHLREYTQRDVARLLRQAGFKRIGTPLCVVPRRIVLCGEGLGGLKRLLEPALEWLPFPVASLLCRSLALNCTLAMRTE